jgi:hypothetical protein
VSTASAPQVDWHPFEPGGQTFRDASGRLRNGCARPGCGAASNAYRHRGRDAALAAGAKSSQTRTRKRRELEGSASPPELIAVPLASPVIRPSSPPVADWRLSMLRLAVDMSLEGPPLSFLLRRALLDTRAALRSELYGTVAVADPRGELPQADAPPAELEELPEPAELRPERTPEPLRNARVRAVAHSFRGDKYRELFLRAVSSPGWRWSLTGSNHVLLISPSGEHVNLSASAQSGRGHGYANVRAQARRAGLDVAGL